VEHLYIALRNASQGHNHGWKVEGTKVRVPTPGHSAPRLSKGRAVCWLWEGVVPSRCEGPGVSFQEYRKIFQNSDATSCILRSCCEISCFLKTTAKKLGDQYLHCWSPNLKVGDQFPPVPMVVVPMMPLMRYIM